MTHKHSLILLLIINSLLLSFITPSKAQTNLAARLDGKENNLCIGMGIIDRQWTIEAWIKRDRNSNKEIEVIFGGGEHSDLRYADNMPLVVRNGRLHCTQANLWSTSTLDNEWHHVALTCDQTTIKLYLDGILEDSKQTTFPIIVGTLGVNLKADMAFTGWLDEVRIWQTALSAETINAWKNKPITPSHSCFTALKGYYNFDEETGSAFINQVGKGIHPFHIRNYRINYRSDAPYVTTVPNDNPHFQPHPSEQRLFNAIVIDSEWDADQGSNDDPILKLRIIVAGDKAPLSLTALELDLSETTNLSDISKIHIYHTGQKARTTLRQELFGNGVRPQKNISLRDKKNTFTLKPGVNYILITADIKERATPGNRIKIKVPSFSLNDQSIIPQTKNDNLAKLITPKGKNYIKQLNWNIWNAGNHLVENGIDRVVDLIRASDADIVTMQEAYGNQQLIADTLAYYMQTASPKDNLALFSRFPIRQISPTEPFKSNPGIITLPGEHQLLINCCWLRYSYIHEYTGNYPDTRHDTDQWIIEDSIRPLKDIQNIIDKDTKPHFKPGMSVIIAGDFNSCSHLDWTARASALHYGYGPVDFPVSRYIYNEGFIDSFRQINPDETARPEGTYAVIYNQLQTNRIDFIYYKSDKISAVSSRIVRTTPEIDDVWPSDHAAVLTIFNIATH